MENPELESAVAIPEQYAVAINRLSKEILARGKSLHSILKELGADEVEITVDGLLITIEKENVE